MLSNPTNIARVSVPIEISCLLIQFVSDSDLRSVSRVNKLFNALCKDPIIQKLMLKRNKVNLSYKLMKPQRPPLAQLVDDGIVKGLLKMNLDRGDYIGHTPLHDFNSKSRALSWNLTQDRLSHLILKRPDMTSLRGKNLIKSKDSTSSSLVTRIIGLQKMMTSIQLKRVLEHRLKEQLV